MTTIACDGMTVAADGRITSSGEVAHCSAQKMWVYSDCIICGTGTMSIIPVAAKWVRYGADPNEAPPAMEHGWTVWRVSKSGILEYSNTDPYPISYDFPHAMGTGSAYARTAMRLGKTAKEAVEIAAEFDIYTGGAITAYDIP